MAVLGDAHADIDQDIEHLNTQRKDITRNMAQVITLKAEQERVRKTKEENNDLSKYLFLSVLF